MYSNLNDVYYRFITNEGIFAYFDDVVSVTFLDATSHVN
jgi:hypothetical protein